MLKDDMKAAMMAAMRAGQKVEKGILRVALGEIQTIEARSGEDASDAEGEKILRKLIKSIGESRDAAADEAQKATLAEEIAVLERFLPKTLSVEEIIAALAPLADAILGAGNDGQATGMAMKHLKSTDAVIEGGDVSVAVRQMRG